MRTRLLISLTTLLLMTTTSWAASVSGDCQVQFSGDSTLHSFEGQATCAPFDWPLLGVSGSGPAVIENATIKIPVKGMDTDNDRRDNSMYKMFSAEDFPLIEGHFSRFDPNLLLAQLRQDAASIVRLPFELKIRDVTRPVEAKIHNLREKSGQITFTAEFSVSLKNFQLKAPGVLGIIKVGDEVNLQVEVVLPNIVEQLAENVNAAN